MTRLIELLGGFESTYQPAHDVDVAETTSGRGRFARAVTGEGFAMTDRPDVSEADADETEVTTVPLEDEDGDEYVIAQQNVEYGDTAGGGEWPHPDTPPSGPAPGTAADPGSPPSSEG